MKNKYRNQIKIINYITSTEMFKIIFWIGIILAAYASFILGISKDNFIDAIFIPFQFPIFNIIFFAMLFLNNLNTCTTFEKHFSFYIIRLKNKRNYIKEIIKNSIAINLFYILLFLLFYFTFLNLVKFGNFGIHNYMNYSVSNIFYVIYYLARYILIAISVTTIFTIIYLNFKTHATFIASLVFLVGFLLTPQYIDPISNLNILIWNFFDITRYDNLSLDITSSLLMLIILEIIILVGYRLTIKNKRLVIT